MNVSIIGDGLTSLLLAKSLVDMKIKVTLFAKKRIKKKIRTRTIGIANENFDFINKNIINIKKISWNINKIEIFSEKLKNKKLLNFEKKKTKFISYFKKSSFL